MKTKPDYTPLKAFSQQFPRNLESEVRRVNVSERLKPTFKSGLVPPNTKMVMVASATPSNNASRSVSTRGHILTYTEKAKQSLLDSLVQIPGVLVRTYGGATLGERAIKVTVPDILGPTADQVYLAEIRTRRQFRTVHLNLEIEEAANVDTSVVTHSPEE